MNIFVRCFKPKFYKRSKSTTSYMKIRLDIVRKKRIALVKFLKMDIVDFLNNGLDYNAYTRTEMLLEEFRIISCYDIIERFCDCISENLSPMLKERECPEECKEAASSLIYAAAWVPDVPELKDLRSVFTHRFGSFNHSSVNHELVEKTELRSRPSRELKIQTVKDIANEYSIDWDPTALNLFLLRQTSALQIEDKVDTTTDDPKTRAEINGVNDQSEDESVLSQSWTRDSPSKGSFSSSSSSSSPRRDSEKKKKKIYPYGLISPTHTKPRGGTDETAQEEKEKNNKSGKQENSRLLEHKAVSTRMNERTSSFFQTPKLLHDEVVARLAAIHRI
ncbi:unnamed protein product [Eruca vesicaria subsp. sativa]|uniref:IST1-like protein n=1 Tax=Eruca vesicaria subsp. sativa TaxID=29727 RepID=A0ABC8KTU4_ERUVS|nr:unnamed protein product [Eruca vesicaria subsp. sativa]